MIWLGIPREDLDLGGLFSKLRQAVIKAEVAHNVLREAEEALARAIQVVDGIEKLAEFRETAAKLGRGDLQSWAELLKAAAGRPGADPDAARVLSTVAALIGARGDVRWEPGREIPPALRIAASHRERVAIFARQTVPCTVAEQVATLLSQLIGARVQAQEEFYKALKEPAGPVKRITPILIKTVEKIVVRGSRSLVAHRVLAGGDHAMALQDMGNNPREIEVTGLLTGDRSKSGKGKTVDQQVEMLQDAMRSGKPLVFATDAPGLQPFGPTVVIAQFDVLASESLVGAVRFRYRLVESPPSPPKRKPRGDKKDDAKDWVRYRGIMETTAYATRFVDPATGKPSSDLAAAVRDRMLTGGTITGLPLGKRFEDARSFLSR
jgi:hypothetical protein